MFSRIILWMVNLGSQQTTSLALARLLKDPHMVCLALSAVYGDALIDCAIVQIIIKVVLQLLQITLHGTSWRKSWPCCRGPIRRPCSCKQHQHVTTH